MKWRSNFWNRSSVPPPNATGDWPKDPKYQSARKNTLRTPVILRIEKRTCQIYYFFSLPLARARPSIRLAGGLITDPNPAPIYLLFSPLPSLLFLPFIQSPDPE
jgi:hypothetical protein